MKKVFENFIYNLSYQVFSFVLPIITMPYITSIISQKMIGINSLMQANSSYFILFGMLGITIYGAREIAKYQSNKEALSNNFFKIYKIQLISHFICLILYLVYTYMISYKLLGLFYILNIFASMFDISWFYIGIEDFKSIAIRNVFVKLISFAFLFILVKSDSDIYLYICTLYIPQILINFFMWKKIKKYLYFTRNHIKERPTRKNVIETVSLFIPQLSSSVYTLLDKTVLGFFVNYTKIAIYDQGQIIIRLFLAIVPSFSRVMMPRITRSIYAKDNDLTEYYMVNSSNIIWFISFGIFFGVFAIADLFIAWYLPPKYAEVSQIIILSSPIILAVSGANLISVQFLIPLGKEKIYTLSLIIASIMNFILNLIIIPIYGIYGACISSIISETVGFLIQLVCASKYINIRKIFKNIPVFLISGLIMMITLILIKRCFIANFTSLLFLVLIGTIIYIFCNLTMIIFNRYLHMH